MTAYRNTLAAVIQQVMALVVGGTHRTSRHRMPPRVPDPPNSRRRRGARCRCSGGSSSPSRHLVGVSGLSYFRQVPGLSAVLLGVAWVAGAALPAALLYRVPRAWRGRACCSPALPPGASWARWTRRSCSSGCSRRAGAGHERDCAVGPLGGPGILLGAAGTLLVAVGLARLRWQPASRRVRPLLPVAAAGSRRRRGRDLAARGDASRPAVAGRPARGRDHPRGRSDHGLRGMGPARRVDRS